MAPIRGWCARGRRLAAKIPHGQWKTWKTMTFLAALRCDRIEAPWVLDGPINGESFRTYVDQVLVPTLKPGDVVILDNLGSHKGKAVRRAIRATGARLLFLPPYSPDLNPIDPSAGSGGLRQTETSHPKGQGANRRRYLETHRLIARNLQIQRMQKLPRQCRLRFILK